MASDVKITITADTKDVRKEYKNLHTLVNRFDKTNKKLSKRRVKQTKTSSTEIKRITASEVRFNLALHKRTHAALARDRKREERDAIRSEKKIARERERVLKRHAAKRRRLMRGVGRVSGGIAGLLGIGGGIGLLYKAREVVKFDEALARLSVQAGVSVEKQFALRDAFHRTALDIGAQREVMIETAKTIVDLSGDFDLASEGLTKFAKIIRGTGADASELGTFAVALKDSMSGIENKELFDLMELLIAQGDKAKVNIAAMATEGAKLFGAFRGKGFQGKQSFAEFGAFVQLAARSGEIAEGTTSVVRFLDSLIKRKDELEAAKVTIFGSDKEIRNFGDILKDILRVTGGDITKLKTLFPNIRSLRAIELLGVEYRRANGEIKEYNNLVDIGLNASENIEKKYQRVAQTSSQGFNRMAAAITLVSDKALVGVLNDMSDAIGRLLDDPQKLKQLEETARAIGDMFRLIGKAGMFGVKAFRFLAPTGGRAARSQRKIETLPEEQQRGAKLTTWEKFISFNQIAAQEKKLEQMELNVYNNVVLGPSGNVYKSKSILKAQIHDGRGAVSGMVTRELAPQR
ncbi:MAG: hypothetical protein KAI70_00660 [Candidatus Omnitrophica bacterium]|nr:hypothetical protein [Candidatus Omnitrophota bacterium]